MIFLSDITMILLWGISNQSKFFCCFVWQISMKNRSEQSVILFLTLGGPEIFTIPYVSLKMAVLKNICKYVLTFQIWF